MNGIAIETAIVYRAAGRRWLTLRGAARAAAKKHLRDRWRASGDDPSDISIERWARIVSKLAYKYERSTLASFSSEPTAHDPDCALSDPSSEPPVCDCTKGRGG